MVTLGQGLTCLTALTRLCIRVDPIGLFASQRTEVRTMFEWAGLVSLVQLHITGYVFWKDRFDLSGLASLSNLKEVVLDRHVPQGISI